MKHQFVLSIYHSMRGHTSLFLCRFKIEISFSSKQSMPRPFSQVYKIRRTINPVIITSSEERICGKFIYIVTLLNLTFYNQKSAPFLYEDTSCYTLCTFFYLNNRVFLLRNYRLIVAPRKFDVLKTNICPRSEASRANMLVLRTSNFQGATIRPIVPRHKHSIVFIVHY